MSFHVTKLLAAAIVVLAVFAGQAQAQNDILARWTFEPEPFADAAGMNLATGPSVTATTGTGMMFGVHASAASDWSTPTGQASGNAYSGNEWAVSDYFEFQTSSATFSDIGIVFDQMGSNTGPRDFKLQYSTDGSSFTDFGDPYQVLNGNWNSNANFPTRHTTYAFDLSSVTALNNDSSIYFRLVNTSTNAVNSVDPVAPAGTSRVDNITIYGNFEAPPPVPPQRLVEAGDVVLGTASGMIATTFEVISGPPSLNGGAYDGPGPWPLDTSFVQSLRFDNTGGTWHNVKGNLIGVDFGSGTTGGTIRSFGTQGSIPLPGGQIIGNTRAAPDNLGQAGDGSVATARLAGLSVSPDNNKIAVVGVSLTAGPVGTVIVYDYNAGNTMGSGASLLNGRDTDPLTLSGSTQGTAWLDNETVVVARIEGTILEINDNGTTLTVGNETPIQDFAGVIGTSFHSAIAYNPGVSSYMYAVYSIFDGADSSSNQFLYILDPTDDGTPFSLVNKVDLSTSMGSSTAREAALDADGNLFIGGFGGVIHVIPDAVANAETLADNSSLLWYDSIVNASFTGLEVGIAPPTIDGDYNGDGVVDAGDYVRWRNHLGEANEANINNAGDGGGVTISDYGFWKARYGNPGGGGGGLANTIPEPTALALVMIGLAGFALGRRAARGAN